MSKEITSKNNEIKNLAAEIAEKMGTVRGLAIVAIHDMVTEMGGTVIVDYDDDDFRPYISYDGGAHPEYATNMFSEVYNVKAITKAGLKGFAVDIDECDKYDNDRMLYDDILAVFDFVSGKYEKFCQEK